MQKSQIGLIGLAVMGANLARNLARNKFKISVYNRTKEKTSEFLNQFQNEYLNGFYDLKKFVENLEKPRKIILMVQAGDPVDSVINQLTPYLDKNDILIDCGNSNYKDSQKRQEFLKKQGVNFLACGISGGEEGALNGPSLMPSGDKKVYDSMKIIFEKIAAKDFLNKPCVSYIGENGAGHYVKMVHNGIEYAVMEIMAEAYDILRKIYDLKAVEIAEIFKKFNNEKLESYLFYIAEKVLQEKDQFKKGYLIDYILDEASQKGTGKWASIDALDRGVSVSAITEAVFARMISNKKEIRINFSKNYLKTLSDEKMPLEEFLRILEEALYCGLLITYAQGYDLISEASKEEKWTINFAEISRIWQGGCIIRAKILDFIYKAFFTTSKNTTHLFEIDKVRKIMQKTIPALQKLCIYGINYHIPMPSLVVALTYFDQITSKNLPANFIQGLRDYFGAHSYQRIDKIGIFHTKWDL
jgi:6-phosphogluconate dehydrogenase